MSRGLGKIQQKLLEMFEKNSQQVISTFNAAGYVYETATLDDSQLSSIRRALRKLKASGHIKALGHNSLGRKCYAHTAWRQNYRVPFCMSDLSDKLGCLLQEN
jgi:hypothetical protein